MMAVRVGPPTTRPVALVATAEPRFVAEAGALDAWAMRATPGSRCLYARASRLPTGGVGERARHMFERGMVELARTRDPEFRDLFAFTARRTAAPFAAPPPKRTAELSAEDAALLDLLVEAADAGARCPGNRALAARLGWKSERSVEHRLGRLRAAGAIRVWLEDDGLLPNGCRVVEIVATGATTARGTGETRA